MLRQKAGSLNSERTNLVEREELSHTFSKCPAFKSILAVGPLASVAFYLFGGGCRPCFYGNRRPRESLSACECKCWPVNRLINLASFELQK